MYNASMLFPTLTARPLLLAMLTLFAVHPAAAETISVQLKGFDDGVRTSQQQDYKEAVLFAKRDAIERAGVRVKSLTTVQDFVVASDYIETQAEAVLRPGYTVMDIGYQEDGTYLVVLTGEVAVPSAEEAPPPIVQALLAISESPQDYVWDLGRMLGQHEIEKAYFAGNGFVIHYAFNNGVATLAEASDGSMLLTGEYTTSKDKGSIRLDFNADGTAEGEWRNFLSRGNVTISRRPQSP